MFNEIVTKDMILQPVDPKTSPVYLKVIVKHGVNERKVEERLKLIDKNDRKFISIRDETRDSYWLVFGYDKYFLDFPEFKRANNLLKKRPGGL